MNAPHGLFTMKNTVDQRWPCLAGAIARFPVPIASNPGVCFLANCATCPAAALTPPPVSSACETIAMPTASPTLTTSDLRAAIDRLPRFPLGHFPTPLELAGGFSKTLGGPQVYVKRDELHGLALRRQQNWHNELLIADALRRSARSLSSSS